MNYYIVLFKDGSIQVYNKLPEKEHFASLHGIYECESRTTIQDISEWIGSNYKYGRKIYIYVPAPKGKNNG